MKQFRDFHANLNYFRKLKYELSYKNKELENENSYNSAESISDLRIDNELLKKEIMRLKSLISNQKIAYQEHLKQNDFMIPKTTDYKPYKNNELRELKKHSFMQPVERENFNMTYDENDLYS